MSTRDTHSQSSQLDSSISKEVKEVDAKLGTGLKTRHLTMMGLGSAIGAGLFLGTGVGIQAAGPAILIAYILAGIMVVFVMQMLGEMAAARPCSGSFSTFSEMAFGHWAGFSMGWMYWYLLVMVMGAEMTGAAGFMQQWFHVARWIPALVCVIFFAVVNLAKVTGFGEFEYWFAIIKVAVIVIFLVVGVLMIFGLLPGTHFVGLENFIGDHGFLPHGWKGMAAGLLAVAFAFGGIEIVTIAAAESENPAANIGTAVRSTIWRIAVFYLGAVLVITFLMPYEKISGAKSAADSPFTIILDQAGIPGISTIMEIVIVLALLSAFNAQIYGTSRIFYSLAARGNAPKVFAKLSHDGVPTNAVILSMLFAFGSVAIQAIDNAKLISFLFNVVGGTLLLLWAFVILSYLKLHKELVATGEITKVRMWGYPWLGWVTLIMLLALTGLMLSSDQARGQVTSVLIVFVIVTALSFTAKRGRAMSLEAKKARQARLSSATSAGPKN